MNTFILNQQRLKHSHQQLFCFSVFSLSFFVILIAGLLLKDISPGIFQSILLFLGWYTWTFLEYIAHRFWMHNKPAKKEKHAFSNHMYHHTHPTELKVTDKDRILLLISGVIIINFAILFHNYFTLFAGFYMGFLSYTFMHVVLHREWAKIVFPRLLKNHILHHCKFTNKCFGVTVIWWDKLFATAAPRDFHISDKVIRYYFGDKNHE